MNDYRKELKSVETKIKNNELKSEKELNEYLTELKNRGILTQAQINLNQEDLASLFETKTEAKKTTSSKRITRTPQNRYF